MKRRIVVLVGVLLCLAAGSARADEYGVAPLNDAPPSDGLAEEVAAQLAATGVRVTRDSSPYCDLWLCKSLAAVSDFKPTSEILYPFQPGQLIGLIRFSRRGADFRDQDIRAGVYTLRYSQQPVDGAHVGTSATRDFVLLLNASKDRSAGVLEYKNLTKQSSDAARSSHPAILCLHAVPGEAAEFPSIRHEEQHNWWVVALRGEVKKDGSVHPLPVGLVVVGVAPE